MTTIRKKAGTALFWVAAACIFAATPSLAANKTLTIKGSNTDSGDTIAIPDTAQVNLAVGDQGITITMPDLDLRLRCLGDVTADGYCYIAAGGTGGGSGAPDDLDFDRVPDIWDQCPSTPAGAPYTDKRGCADIDGDSYFTPEDECPTQGTQPVDSVGCPITTASFTVTASAGTGGTIAPAGERPVEDGGTLSFTVTPSAGYSFNTIGGTCPKGVSSGTSYRTGAITENCTVIARFTASTTSGYCVGAPPDVICDPNSDGEYNAGGSMDSWKDGTWGFVNTPIPKGKIVAFPFLANAGTGNSYSDLEAGIMEFSNNMADLSSSDYSWKGWFSETPGGAVLNDNAPYCRKYSPNPNPQQIKWSQSSTPDDYACDLGRAERVLYFNMEVACYEELLASVPLNERACTVGDRHPMDGAFAAYGAYYIKIYPR
jgi:hypothetical protein